MKWDLEQPLGAPLTLCILRDAAIPTHAPFKLLGLGKLYPFVSLTFPLPKKICAYNRFSRN